MAASNSPWRARWTSARAPLLLAAVTFLAYSNSFPNGFTLDSRQAILNDTRVHEVSSRNLSDIFTHTYWWPYDSSGLYRPLTTLSYLFDYAVLNHGDRPAGYHALNLLLHLANVLLVYAIARRLTRYPLPAALLWAVHPVLTESVTNLVGRADLLAALGTLVVIWSTSFWGVLLGTTLAIFSKESAVVIPLLLLLFTRDRRRLAAAVLPIAAFLFARYFVLADAMPRNVPFTDNPLAGADFVTAKLAALGVLGRYVWLLGWPAELSADYSWAQIPAALHWPALATVLAAAAAGLRWNRRALAWAAIAILPVSNLLLTIGTVMAERFLYLPAIAFALCLAALWRWRAGQVAVCAIVLAFAARTWVRNLDWRDDRAMAESLVRASPASFKAHRLLAQTDPARTVEEAEKALAILDPLPDDRNYSDTWRLAGVWFAAAGRYQRSADVLERAWRIVEAERRAAAPGAVYPGMTDLLGTLASDYLALGRLDDAAVTLVAGQLSTGDFSFRNRLLDLYGGIPCALTAGPSGPAINPGCPDVHRHLCAALAKTGKTSEFTAYKCMN